MRIKTTFAFAFFFVIVAALVLIPTIHCADAQDIRHVDAVQYPDYDSEKGEIELVLDVDDPEREGMQNKQFVYGVEIYDSSNNMIYKKPDVAPNPDRAESAGVDPRLYVYIKTTSQYSLKDLPAGDYVIHIYPHNTKLSILEVAFKVDDDTTKHLNYIEVTKDPDKTVYCPGEQFDRTGMTVIAHFTDGSSQDVVDEVTIDPVEMAMGMTSVNVNYTYDSVTKSDTVEVKVHQLTGIEITQAPGKTTYTEGEVFNPSGMQVTAHYSDGTSKTVTSYTYPQDPLVKGTTSIEISYTEGSDTKTAEQQITVNAKPTPPGPTPPGPTPTRTLTGLEITKHPEKTQYVSGEQFDPKGMEVTAVFSDGFKSVVTTYTYEPQGPLDESVKEIVVSYKYGGITKEAKVPVSVEGPAERYHREYLYNDPDKNLVNQVIDGTVTVGKDGRRVVGADITVESSDGMKGSGKLEAVLSSDDEPSEFEYDITYDNPDGTKTRVIGKGNLDSANLDVSGSSYRDVVDAIDSMHPYRSKSVNVNFTASSSGEAVFDGRTVSILADKGYGMSLTNGKLKLSINSTVVKGIRDAGGHDIRLIVIEATKEMKTEDQDKVIQARYSVKVALLIDGVEVHGLYGGRANVEVDPGFDVAYVYYVSEKGDVEEIPSSYDKKTGVVEFTVTHLSIYMITAEKYVADDGCCWWCWLILIIIIILLIFLIYWIYKRYYEDRD